MRDQWLLLPPKNNTNILGPFLTGKEKKKADKTKDQAQPAPDSATGANVSADELRTALEKVRGEEVPQTAEQKEHYFMSQVSMGEQLCQQGKF